jgi:hypothetical protein
MKNRDMDTPKNLITLGQAESERLTQYLSTLPPDAWTLPSACERWAVRDVVGHLTWVAEWYVDAVSRAIQEDVSPPAGFPPAGASTGASRNAFIAQSAIARREPRLAGPLGGSPFRFDAGAPRPVRYRFALSGAVPSTHDLLVENEQARMEPAGTATPHVTFHCETDIFVLMMYRRLTLEPVIASGQLVVEGDQGLTAAFDCWLKGA